MAMTTTSSKKISTMCILNITPDSFSDGNTHFTYNDFSSYLEKLINEKKEKKNTEIFILDFGAHSTAPFNNNISCDEELNRFEETLIRFFKENRNKNKNKWPEDIAISIDTYRPQVFHSIYNSIKKLSDNQNISFIWNDISGVVDEDVVDLLTKEKNVKYVLSYNRASLTNNREIGTAHLQHAKDMTPDELLEDIVKFFKSKLAFIDIWNSDKVFLDPCFGFAKTRNENQILLDNLDKIIEKFPLETKWLIGISKKSFLRKPSELGSRDPLVIEEIEKIHLDLLSKWIKQMPNNFFVFRVHNIEIVQNAYSLCH
ncbi:MAG: dihydropteroate synthase [Oligoflexia bacterium]|nr:dihydropteroate synthase [Oligoflexia bacterium]